MTKGTDSGRRTRKSEAGEAPSALPHSVAVVAASSVDGYLRNASRRLRVPTAEGGRGTRRKLDMVTSAATKTDPATMTTVVAAEVDEEEWDEVELVGVTGAVKRPESECVASKAEPSALASAQLPLVKPDAASLPVVKPEPGPVREEREAGDEVMAGAHRPLTEQPPRPTWQRDDPAYEAMLEQRDLLAAQRRSERMRRTAVAVTQMLLLLHRGRLLWREAHHPRLVAALLRLRSSASGAASAVFVQAVRRARVLVLQAERESASHKPSLAPAWVTLGKDAVQNPTSRAVVVLLRALDDHFSVVPQAVDGDDAATRMDVFTSWHTPLTPGVLYRALRRQSRRARACEVKIELPHPLYLCVLFLALARLSGLDCRLVIAKQHERAQEAATGADAEAEAAPARRQTMFQEKMSLFMKRATSTVAPAKRDEGDELKSRRLPTSCFWVEVWSVERQCFVSVNPCAQCSTLWGAPYTFSFDGNVVVDATPRYTSKYSAAFAFNRRLGRCRQYSFLWRDRLTWDDNREVSEVLLESFCAAAAHTSPRRCVQRERERRQLEALAYAERVPTTLNALHHHPLFVIESDLARHEGIYPKDNTTIVGSVKGRTVYKRSAVVSLRSRDGWLREKRGVREGETAYKTTPPPSSRPFAAASLFYGVWQTEPFVPLPLREDGTIPHHGRTSWYILLDQPPPPSIAHLTQPQIGRVARRMQLSFGYAVTGFVRRRINERRRGHWEAVLDGIVVPEAHKDRLVRAYEEWVQLVQEQEAAKRRDRALHWWLLLTQRTLAMDRLQAQYLRGKTHGALPTQ